MNAATLEPLFADHSVVVDGDRRIDDVGDRAGRVAAGLREQGVRRGDSVAFQLGNSAEAVVAYRACWRLGARAVAIHHRAAPAETDHLISQVEPTLVLRDTGSLHELERAEPSPIEAEPDDEAVVLFTAGSTGRPKGVRHTQRALAYKAALMQQVHGLTPDDVVLMPAPLAHISGLLNGVLVPGVTGMTTVLMGRWSPSEALALIEREHVSFMVGPPTFFVDLMEDPSFRRDGVKSLRLVSTGGAGVAPTFVTRASRTLGALVKRSYGSTEAPTVATTYSDEPIDPHLDGHVIGAAELRVVDGELLVRGPELFLGYLDGEQTAAAMTDDGWYRTGDLAHIEGAGWLLITGRLNDIVIRAGENVSIREVEDTLHAHPNVAAASVVGVPHDRLGEQLAAAVVTNGQPFTLEECRAWFDQRGVTKFKTPEIVVVVDALPLLPTGKVDATAVRSLVRRA